MRPLSSLSATISHRQHARVWGAQRGSSGGPKFAAGSGQNPLVDELFGDSTPQIIPNHPNLLMIIRGIPTSTLGMIIAIRNDQNIQYIQDILDYHNAWEIQCEALMAFSTTGGGLERTLSGGTTGGVGLRRFPLRVWGRGGPPGARDWSLGLSHGSILGQPNRIGFHTLQMILKPCFLVWG